MDLHPLLKRQLKRLMLTISTLPNRALWHSLLETISRTYLEADQERYLLERSMEISSEEASSFNDKLEYVQHLAHLGFWIYDKQTEVITFSKEMYPILGMEMEKHVLTYNDLLKKLHSEDRAHLKVLVDRALNFSEPFAIESKLASESDNFRWCYFEGIPSKNSDTNKVKYLTVVTIDITERKLAEQEVHKLNKQLLTSARRAGMSEVATSILHNLGNVLNSINISIGAIQKSIEQMDIMSLLMVVEMINSHLNDLQNYIQNDPKGMLLPRYMTEASQMIEKEVIQIKSETERLDENINHVKNIVAMQNTLSGVSGIMEDFYLSEIIESALNINSQSLDKKKILIEKNIDPALHIKTDKNKLIQIIINLIQNAKDALQAAKLEENKKITVAIKNSTRDKYLTIIITDNGIGIPIENLTKIFSFGFTTKPKGHGFGLHSSALLAKELGGTLKGMSSGVGKGASFILTIPLTSKNRIKKHA